MPEARPRPDAAGAPDARAPLVQRVLEPFQSFASLEASGGIVLLACAVVALAWANSPWAASYRDLWQVEISIPAGELTVHSTLQHLINDGLMAVFFLLVGLEIKRELLAGELASLRRAALPVTAAVGGMVVPAVLYAMVNAGGSGAAGWGIPMATDIAFALGVLALLGDRVPVGLRVFLAAFAIVDDIGAVLVIALFYSSGIAWGPLAAAGAIFALATGANAAGVQRAWAYGLIGLALWAAVLASGIHATVAGVLLAMTIPAQTLLVRLERALHGLVAFGIMPLFALANAGVGLGRGELGAVAQSPVAIGIVLGLVLGKPLGITLFSWVAARAGLATLPANVTWRSLHGVGWLGGIGFTMALFIAGLAFGQAPELLTAAKVGILGASVVAGIAGWLVLRLSRGALNRDRNGCRR